MNAPFAESIVGSWLFTRSTHPNFKADEPLVYHFTADGRNYWEVPDGNHARSLLQFGYKISGDTLIIIYKDKEGTHRLSYADDGSIEFPNSANEHTWWMVPMKAPETFSIAFVGPNGLLQKLPAK